MIEPPRYLQDELLARIRTFLETGGCLTESTLAYIASTLFPPDRDRLATFLSHENGCERDSLLDLIYSPGEAVQVDLEPLLERARFSVSDERVIHDRLTGLTIMARIHMPDGRPLVSIRLPDFVKTQCLERLKISWRLDDRVAAAVMARVSSAGRSVVKVRLRNAGMYFTAAQQVFFCRFLERIPDNDSDYLACLDLMLSLLEAVAERSDGYDILAGYKQRLFRSLQQIKRFDTLLQRSNMEILMLQGVRAPQGSYGALMEQVRLTDRISFNVFGKTEAIDFPVDEPADEVGDLDTPEAIFRSLMK